MVKSHITAKDLVRTLSTRRNSNPTSWKNEVIQIQTTLQKILENAKNGIKKI